jgi:hypothetical protein
MNSYNGTADASGTYPVGTTTVVWTIKDQSDNTTTCSMTVTVEDNEAPNTQCNNITVQLDASGAAGIVVNDIDNNSTDNCGIDTRSIDINSFDCSDVGANTVTLTITDIHGNTSTCQSTVTVEDNIDPIAICKNATVQLDANGQGSITTADIDNGSNDACGIASLSLDKTDFNCADVGQNTVTLTVEDNNGNISTCQATVTVRDEVKPTAICKNITVQLDASGAASITAYDVDDNSWDACGIASLSVSPTTFNCSNVGGNTVTLVVIDNNGNMSTCQSTVTIEDNVAPQAICQNVTVQLDANGNGSITANDVDNGSNDACGIASMTVSPNTFDCGDVGANTVTLTVTDNNGNVSTCTATATVEDNVDPVAICKDVTVQLDAAGNGSIVAADIDNGSNDACGIASLTASQTTFDCGDVGNNTITLTVEDNNGNTSTCTATVTVEDNVAPVAECQSITVQLNASGAASITASQIDNGSNDACGIANMTVSPSSFDCSNVGANTVTLTVTDNNGNSSTCTATVTIEDNVAPVAQCQNVTVQLDANGDGSITASQVDNGSSDACGIASMKVSPSTFDCGDVGANTVTLTLTDNNGNVSTCTATVTVEDNVAPVAQCQNVTVALDGNGNASVTASQVDNGSNDACGIANLSLSQTDFDCDDLGTNTVTLTVTDNNGNSSTCTAQVLVQDNTDPVISNMPSNMTVRAERNDCDPVVMWNPPTAADNCTVQSFTSTAHPGDEFPVGTHTVTYTAVDQSNNTTTASFTITVEPDPLVVTSLTAHEYNGRWNISCNGEYDGSAKVIIEGGCLPYTYNWSNGSTTDAISNVPAGTYTIVVTDANGTTISDQITLHEPNVLTATVDKTDIVCHIEAESTCEMDEYTKVKYGGHAVWLPNLPGSPSSKYVFDNKGSFETYADGSARISGTVVNASDPAYSWEVEIWLTGKMDWSNWSAMSRGWKGNSYIVGNNYKNWDYYVMDNARLATLKGKGNYAGKTLYLNHKPSNQYYGFQVGKSANDKDYSYGMSGWFTYTGDYSGHGDVNVDLDDCKGNNKCDCEGRMRNFSVAYSGSDNATIKIVTGSNPSKNCVSLSSITGVDDGDIVTIQGNWKDGRLGPKTWLIINGNTYQIHTSCSEPILGNSYGPFTVVSYTDGDGNYCEVGTGSLGCDGTASLNITGGTAPYTVNWSNGSTGTGVSGICMGTYSVSVTDANGCSWDTEVTINNPEELDLDLDGDNPNCYQGNDGSIDLTVTGGVAPYTYIWSNNATTEDLSNLPAGEYEVIVTDAGGCSISGTVTLKDPKPSLYINACADDVNCYGGSDGEIDLKVYCSNKVASYSWSNNATTADIDNLSAGTYTVTVTDYNGCSLTESFDVEEPDALLVSASSPEYSNGYNVSSHGADDGSIDLDVSGGTPGYSYDWNGSAQKSATLTRNVESRYGDAEEDHRGRMSTGSGDLDLGDYRVGVYFDDIDIPQGAEIVEAYIQFTAAGSDNNTANFTIKGHDVNHSYKFKSKKRDISRRTTTSASVNWQPGAWSRNASGSAQRTSDISSVVQEIVDRGGWRDGYAMSFIITGSGDREAYTYDGSRGRAPKLVIRYKQDVTGNDPEDLPAGYYTVRVTDKNGCAANTSITLTQPNKGSGAVLADKTVMENAENEATTDVELEIGPNPVENFAVVRFTLEEETQALVRVVDMSGKTLQTVYTGNVMAAEQVQVQTDLSQLRSGMYQIIITTTSGKQTVKRFVVAR